MEPYHQELLSLYLSFFLVANFFVRCCCSHLVNTKGLHYYPEAQREGSLLSSAPSSSYQGGAWT